MAQDNIVKVYLSVVRFVLEYAVPVRQAIINSALFIRCNRGSPKKGFEDNLSYSLVLYGGIAIQSKRTNSKEKKR